MGGGQSQHERVVTVEEEQREGGHPQLIVTEDVLKYISDQQQGPQEGPGGSEEGTEPSGEGDIPYLSAEDVLTGPTAVEEEEEPQGSEEWQQLRQEGSRWRQKYEQERRKNTEVSEMVRNEIDKTASSVKEKLSSSLGTKASVCEECRDKVLECYSSNPERTLNCSAEARDYIQCVEKARKRLYTPTATAE